jgi:hypothetical protein
MTVTAPANPLWRTWFGAVTVGEFAGFLMASIGTAQWLVLRRLVPRAWRWMVATVAAVTGIGVERLVTDTLEGPR